MLHYKVVMKWLGRPLQHNIVDRLPYIPTVPDRWRKHTHAQTHTHTEKRNTGEATFLQLLLVINDNMKIKKQIKNRTLHTCRLVLPNWIFQYISNWSKVFVFFYPPPFFNIRRAINFEIFLGIYLFSSLCRFI